MPASTKLVGIAALLLVLCDVAAAFAPGAALQPTNRLGLRAAQPVSRRLSRPAVARLSMQEGGEPLYEDDSDAMVAQKMAQKSSKQGGISDGMRAKLLKENQVRCQPVLQFTAGAAGGLFVHRAGGGVSRVLTRKTVHAGAWGRPRCSVRPRPSFL